MKKSNRKPGPGRPVTTGSGLQLQVRVHAPDLEAIDAWIAAHQKAISRPEAIRRMIQAAAKLGDRSSR